ncbi:hypothetical protein G4B88_017341 [Cannabis sativa]|uniref:Reverse transcriptase zinc-binding domain-containing protein n=1 Tax=Cannabis sativa TaxID=3483 RepID=A0A7J6F3W6_CANSA|nr:hypothetical protein G4B88_017341 [Cannabis sativa]
MEDIESSQDMRNGESVPASEQDVELLRQKFLEEVTLELEPDFEISEEVAKTGVLAKLFGNKVLSRGRVKQILGGIWSLSGKWRLKTMENGLWGIFFEKQEDKLEVLKRTPWIISNQLLNVRDWPTDCHWQAVNMAKATFWVEIHRLPTPYLAAQNSAVIGRKILPAAIDRPDGVTVRPGTIGRKGTTIPVDVGVIPSHGTVPDSNIPTMHGECTMANNKGTRGNLQKGAGINKRKSARFNPLEVVSNHPIANLEKHPSDDYVILSLMPNVGPTAEQMVDLPHESISKSRTPHRHPEPIILPKSNSDKVEKLAELLLGSSISTGLVPPSDFIGPDSIPSSDLLGSPISPGPTACKKRKAPGSVTPERPSDSPVWRGILDARKTICDGSRTIIATGEDTNLWWQPWIPWMEYEEFRETMEMIRPKAPSLRCVADLMFRNNKTWNRGFLEFLFGHELGSLISTIQINSIAEKDMLIWKNSDTGMFSVKGAYLCSQRTRFAEKKELWKWLWDSKIHPRQSMMLWRAIAGALPTADKYGGSNNYVCPFCGSDSESPLHIFVRCALARAIWFGGPLPIKTEIILGNSLFDFCYSAMINMDTSSRHYFLVWFASILETVWLWRNRLYHGSQVLISIDTMISDACNCFLEMRDIKKNHPERGPVSISRQESPGVTSKMIVTDGSFKDSFFGGAMVAIDEEEEEEEEEKSILAHNC